MFEFKEMLIFLLFSDKFHLYALQQSIMLLNFDDIMLLEANGIHKSFFSCNKDHTQVTCNEVMLNEIKKQIYACWMNFVDHRNNYN